MSVWGRIFCGLLLLALTTPCHALMLDEEQLPPEQEAVAGQLFDELRCAVCQGQSVRDSNAKLAIDMRQAVRSEVKAGKSIYEVRALLIDRYGPQILLQERSPRLMPLYLLVGGIFALLLCAAIRLGWKGRKSA